MISFIHLFATHIYVNSIDKKRGHDFEIVWQIKCTWMKHVPHLGDENVTDGNIPPLVEYNRKEVGMCKTRDERNETKLNEQCNVTLTHILLNSYQVTRAPPLNSPAQDSIEAREWEKQQEFHIMPGRRISFRWMRLSHYSFAVPYGISQCNWAVYRCTAHLKRENRTHKMLQNRIQVSNSEQPIIINNSKNITASICHQMVVRNIHSRL